MSPYISKDQRAQLEHRNIGGAGELAYVLTRDVKRFLSDGTSPSFEKYARAIGALEAVKMEFYRRIVVPYEEKKKEKNGDVY